jgi:hypothetical protein
MLGISPATAGWHLNNARFKLGLATVDDLAAYGRRLEARPEPGGRAAAASTHPSGPLVQDGRRWRRTEVGRSARPD